MELQCSMNELMILLTEPPSAQRYSSPLEVKELDAVCEGEKEEENPTNMS